MQSHLTTSFDAPAPLVIPDEVPLDLDNLLEADLLFDPNQLTLAGEAPIANSDSPAATATIYSTLQPSSQTSPLSRAASISPVNVPPNQPQTQTIAPVLPAPKKKKNSSAKKSESAVPARKRNRAADPDHDENDSDEDGAHDDSNHNPGDSRSRLRTNETRYRQGLQHLFDSLGKALGAPGQSRKKLLAVALERLQQQSTAPIAPLPVDHRALFLTDSTPLAIVALDGRYLDANNALQQMCNRSLTQLIAVTFFAKITDPEKNQKYRSAFQAILMTPTAGERAVPLACPGTQSVYNSSGYMLLMIFSVIMHVDEPRPQCLRMRISPISMRSEEYRRMMLDAFL